jgi:hypothetical protein
MAKRNKRQVTKRKKRIVISEEFLEDHQAFLEYLEKLSPEERKRNSLEQLLDEAAAVVDFLVLDNPKNRKIFIEFSKITNEAIRKAMTKKKH